MKKFTLAFAAALMLCPLAMTGCGGSSGGVVEKPEDPDSTGLSTQDQKGYEDAMKERGPN